MYVVINQVQTEVSPKNKKIKNKIKINTRKNTSP